MLLFGVRNAKETDGHLVARHTPPFPMNNEFVRMTEYVAKSLHDLLMGESESPSSSDSSRGNHHPSHECFMVGTPEGHVKSIHEEEATLMIRSGGGCKGPASPAVGAAEGLTPRAQGSTTPARAGMCGARLRDRVPWRRWACMRHGLRCEPEDHR